MTPEAQRIAIAEACGCKRLADGRRGWRLPDGSICSNKAFLLFCPDYLNDLNAMHEAEKVLDTITSKTYLYVLGNVCGHDYNKYISCLQDSATAFCVIHATAAQRAEAFLKTLSLWDADEEAKLHANIMNQIDPFGQEVY
jgi:hypothetical protein